MKDELRVADKLFLTHLWVCVDSTELPFCEIVLKKLSRAVQIIIKKKKLYILIILFPFPIMQQLFGISMATSFSTTLYGT